jgi:DNA topoisomerase IA
MAKNLLIVESPAKATTINKYLGKDFEVLASYGHVRDLVPKEGAVDPEHDFAMRYDIIERNKKHVDKIVAAARKAEAVFLATDLDREGEAISWHIAEILKERGVNSDTPVKRVVFSEITERAIQEGDGSAARPGRYRWSMPSRPGVPWITWSASISRPCCGRRSAAACRPAGSSRRPCA